MKNDKKTMLKTFIFSICIMLFLYLFYIYFMEKEIKTSSKKCIENSGTPIVERHFYNFGYTFSCKMNK